MQKSIKTQTSISVSSTYNQDRSAKLINRFMDLTAVMYRQRCTKWNGHVATPGSFVKPGMEDEKWTHKALKNGFSTPLSHSHLTGGCTAWLRHSITRCSLGCCWSHWEQALMISGNSPTGLLNYQGHLTHALCCRNGVTPPLFAVQGFMGIKSLWAGRKERSETPGLFVKAGISL